MINLRKKTKLVRLLKKLGDANPESLLVDDLIREIQATQASIPSPYDERPLVKDLNTIKESVATVSKEIGVIGGQFRASLKELSDNIGLTFEEKTKATEELEKKLKKALRDVEIEMLSRLANVGGGSMNRQIRINGVDSLTRYTDINLIGSITAVTNNTNKRVDITFAGSSGITILTATGTINDSNRAFTFTEKPTEIVVNNGSYIENSGWTWNSGTLTATLDITNPGPVGTGGKIYGRK